MMRTLVRSFWTVLALVALWCVPASAAIYWAHPSGATGTCTSIDGTSDPGIYGSIAQAAACLASGDTLHLKAGTYTAGWPRLISNITVKAAPGETATVRPTAGDWDANSAAVFRIGDRSNQTYGASDGTLIVDGAGIASGQMLFSIAGTTNNIRLQHMTIRNGFPNNIFIQGATVADNTYIGYNDIHTCGGTAITNQNHCIYVRGRNTIIEHNKIHGSVGYGIHAYYDQKVNTGLKIRYNEIYQNGMFGALAGSGDNMDVHDNILWGNGFNGPLLSPPATAGCLYVRFASPTNVRVYNNTCYNNVGFRYRIGADANAVTLANNLFAVGHASGALNESGAELTEQTTLIGDASTMVNPGAQNFNLVGAGGGSDGVDDGVTSPFRGFNGLAADIGALEAPIFPTGSIRVDDGAANIVKACASLNVGGPILPASSATGWTFTKAAVAWTVSSSARVGDNCIHFTMSTSATAGQAILATYAPGNVTNSQNIGGARHATLRSFSNFTVSNFVESAPTSVLTAAACRFGRVTNSAEVRGDDEWLSGTNADFTCGLSVVNGCTVAIRYHIAASVSDHIPTAFELRYSRNSGAYSRVPNTATADGIAMATAVFLADGTPTTCQLLTPSGDCEAGQVVQTAQSRPTITLENGDGVEMEWVVKLEPGTTGAFDLRPEIDGGTDLDAYPVLCRLTPGNPRMVFR